MTTEHTREGDSLLMVANDNSPRRPHFDVSFPNGLPWRDPEAVLELAAALGGIAADLWLAARAPLTATNPEVDDPAPPETEGETIARSCT